MNTLTDYQPKIIQDDKPSIAERLGKPYGRKRYRFDLPISAQQLKEQLKRDTSAIAGIPFMQKPFRGKIEEDTFEIAWGRNNTRNSVAPIAQGKIIAKGEHCAAEFDFDVDMKTRATFIFISILLLFVLSNAFIFSASSITLSNKMGLLIVCVVTPLAILIGSFVGIKMGQNDIQKILDYFRAIPGSAESNPARLIE
ncbi:MAG: hypothetical protein IPO31_01525 [Candidatus Obscuribacter sp.]|nr:hypothetical protein [Candidatus Obscuribacter sp.]